MLPAKRALSSWLPGFLLLLIAGAASAQSPAPEPDTECCIRSGYGEAALRRISFRIRNPGRVTEHATLTHAQLSVETMPPSAARMVGFSLHGGRLDELVGQAVTRDVEPTAVTVKIRVGDRTWSVPFERPRSCKASDYQHDLHSSADYLYGGSRKLPAGQNMRCARGQHGAVYFQWEVEVPDGPLERGDLQVVPSAGDVDAVVSAVLPRSGGKTVRVLGCIKKFEGMYGESALALDLRRGDHSLGQVVTGLPYEHGRANEKRLAELRPAYEGARLGLDTLAAPAAVEVKTFREDGQGWVWARVPLPGPAQLERTLVASSPDGRVTLLAAGMPEGGAAPVADVVGRFRTAGRARIELKLAPTAGDEQKIVALPPIEVDLTLDPGGEPKARTAWDHVMLDVFERKELFAPTTPFLQYARTVLAARLAEQGLERPSREDGNLGRPEPDLMSAFTGLAAIQEALQLDGMRPLDRAPAGTLVPVGSLKAPEVRSHPFAKMIGEKKPAGHAMDRLVPEDRLYVHMASIQSFFRMLDTLEDWGQDLAHVADSRAVDRGIRDRYIGQLALDRTALGRLVGEKLVKDVGFIAGDPFIGDGTDVAVLFGTDDPALLATALTPLQLAARMRGATAGSWTAHGVAVETLSSADGSVSLHQLALPGHLVLATSRALADEIAATAAKPARSMAEALDYRYLRTVFPPAGRDGAPPEDGFLVLTDAFVRRVVSPEFKLAAARRMRCVAQLTLCEDAQLLATMERGAAVDLAGLVTRKYLARAPECPDGGAYAFTAGAATCTKHGTLARLAPLSGLPVTHATAAEAQQYRNFVDQYTRYWRTFIDPVGVRLVMGERVSVETVILPLVENTIYTSLKGALGAKPQPLPEAGVTPDSLLSVNLSMGGWSLLEMERMYDLGSWMDEGERPSAWMGDTISVVVHDAQPLFTLDFSRNSFLTNDVLRNASPGTVGFLFYLCSLDMPVVGSSPVKSESAARSFLETAARRATLLARQGWGGGWRGRWAATDPYWVTGEGPSRVLVIPVDLFLIKLRWYVTVHEGRFWISNQMPALRKSLAAAKPGQPASANLLLRSTPSRGPLTDGERLRTASERMRRACLANSAPAWVLLGPGGVKEGDLADAARRTLGYAPQCPEGGTYRYEPAWNEVVCGRHGSPERPRQVGEGADRGVAARALSRLEEASVQLGFTEHGLSTRVEIKIKPAK